MRNRKLHKRRAYLLLAFMLMLLGAAGWSISRVSGGAEYVDAAGRQSVYKLEVAKSRGVIYDRGLQPLTGAGQEQVAAVAPTIEAIGTLETATRGQNRERLALALEDGKPFAMPLSQPVEDSCIDLFTVPVRYQEGQLAPHIIGYLDSMGAGASGIELAMNDVLEAHGGEAAVYYHVDALGRVIAGADRLIVDTTEDSQGGVALTLDAKLQRVVQDAAQELGEGAVVVTEVPGCEIRALASVPDYDPNHMGEAAQAEGSPLLNRAFCAYAPGSVFKLVTAAQALEDGNVPGSFICTGSLNAGGLVFHCIEGTAHGQVGLRGALEKSCNCYFISCARMLGGQPVLGMAYNLGFGLGQEFGRGLFTQAGSLPEGASLENVRALANFAFGQGELAVTPVQVCAMMNAIASGGVYASPKLIAGLVDNELAVTPFYTVEDKTLEVMRPLTAMQLQECLKSAAASGTGRPGAPEGIVCGIKTGTAQTGAFRDGDELLHFWYSGFVCDETGPRYCITVLRESTPDDGGAAARVFKRAAEAVAELYLAEGPQG